MYYKLAINNVKKSFKDYTIYFLTLTFAVCIFYTFNSMSAQSKQPGLGDTVTSIINAIAGTMSYLSVFISFVLGFLVVYANNFLIKRRKKELGLYMSLGMGKNKISKLLVIEEIIIGIASLITGLLLGILVSQGLSIITAKIFHLSIKSMKFIIAPDAIAKTAIYFGIIYIFVMIFNTIVISKYKLIDLLNAHKKNEKINVKNKVIAGIIFIFSIVMIIRAYYIVNKVGINFFSFKFELALILGIIGTGTFFYGLTTFLILVIQKNKKVYLKGLNIFTLRQMNNKINTNFMSMTVICLMLFLTISMAAIGVGIKNQDGDGVTPFDMTVKMYPMRNNNSNLEKVIKNNKVKLQEGDTGYYVTEYSMDDKIGSILSDSDIFSKDENIKAISISDYNKTRELKGKGKISLNSNSVLIESNSTSLRNIINKFVKNNTSIKLNGKEYNIQSKDIINDTNANVDIANNDFTVIVEDKVVNSLKAKVYYLNVNYGENNKQSSEEKYREIFEFGMGDDGSKLFRNDDNVFLNTKVTAKEEIELTTTMMLYVTIYLGSIFLISSAAVLAIQQLSEASDSAERYNSLRKIGVPEKMINRTIFIQTLIYFMLPLILAISHSIFAIYQANKLFESYGISSILKTSFVTIGVISIIYGIYLLATYIGYKNIVKKF